MPLQNCSSSAGSGSVRSIFRSVPPPNRTLQEVTVLETSNIAAGSGSVANLRSTPSISMLHIFILAHVNVHAIASKPHLLVL